MRDIRCCPGLTKLAGTCLAAALAGGAAALAGGSAALAGGAVSGPPGPGVPVVPAAMRGQMLKPGAPTGLTATIGDARVTLSWRPPASDGGAAIVGYDVYLGTSAHSESPNPVNGTLISGTSITVAGLTDGTTYYFTADAVNGAGLHSAASAEVPVIPMPLIAKPGSPNGLTASPGDGQITLAWRAPASGGGAGISGYEVYLGTRPGGESAVPVNGTPVRATSCTVAGLADGTTYYFTVVAVDQANRRGAASGEASATPRPAPRPAPMPATVPTTVPFSAAAPGPAAATATAVLTLAPEKKIPEPVIVSLAAVAVGATAGALTLTARRLRGRPRPRPAAPSPGARAGPGEDPPWRASRG